MTTDDVAGLWHFMLVGYVVTIAIETPVLVVGLSRPHPLSRRIFAGFWLTACTYPIVVVALPILMNACSRAAYLWVAETFAPAAECALFAAAFPTGQRLTRPDRVRDLLVITLANLASFGIGELIHAAGIRI